MGILFFLGSLFFVVMPVFSKKWAFVDLYILFCLYFDIINVLVTHSTEVNMQYFQNAIVLSYSAYYILTYMRKFPLKNKKLLYATFILFVVILLTPLFNGANINQSLRYFSMNAASIAILPIAYHYYSTKGNFYQLLKVVYSFIVISVIAIVVFSLSKTDTVDGRLGTETFGQGIIYFGNMSQRGALTYIAFALLCFPLIFIQITYKGRRFVFMIASVFILVVLFIALKRMALIVVIGGGVLYLLKSRLSIGKKSLFVFTMFLVGVVFVWGTNIDKVVRDSYEMRGGERTFSEQAVQNDIRMYEIGYVISDLFNHSIDDFIFGRASEDRFVYIRSNQYSGSRDIHNAYARILLKNGILGLLAYVGVLIVLFRSIPKTPLGLSEKEKDDLINYRLVFFNLVGWFIISGMVGGHLHITFRGFVFYVSASIAAYLGVVYNNKTLHAKN